MFSLSKTNIAKAVTLIVLLVPTLFIFGSFQLKKGGKDLKLGKKAPLSSLVMEASDGTSYSLDDLQQENGLIVVFSCNTCPFVVGSDKFAGWEVQYNDLYKKAQENKIGFVLINSNAAKRDGVDSKIEMASHAEDNNYGMPYIIDEDSKLADAFGARTTPHAFVFDKNKKLIYKGSIDNSWDSKRTELETYLYDAIDHLNSGSDLINQSTPPRGCSIKRTK